eukprot:Awhi_evm1s1674
MTPPCDTCKETYEGIHEGCHVCGERSCGDCNGTMWCEECGDIMCLKHGAQEKFKKKPVIVCNVPQLQQAIDC